MATENDGQCSAFSYGGRYGRSFPRCGLRSVVGRRRACGMRRRRLVDNARFGALPAGSAYASLPGPKAGVRRTSSVPTCSGGGSFAFVGYGESNVADGTDSTVVDGYANQACDSESSILGGLQNAISSGVPFNFHGSAIVAGTHNVITNSSYAFLGGGDTNEISSATDSVIVGGHNNTLSGEYGFIGAGLNNNVSGEGAYIAAGGYNTASGEGAVIDGGFNSTAAGKFATIPGGYVNSAAGTYSFAAGARASAAQTGTFVWSDGSDGDTILTSTAAYQFLARASGGFTLYTNAASTVGAQLAAGSGTWASLSDRNAKTNIAPLDDASVLAKVAALPIERWSYKSERGVRHVGPMAQDFYAAFGVGEDDKHITSIDEDGVALAAIKALHRENGALHAENAQLRARLAAVTASQVAQIAALKASQARHDLLVDRRLERLSAAVSASRER